MYLFISLLNSVFLLPPFSADGSWDSSSVRLLKLGVLPVKALLAVGARVWASSGGHVFVVDAHTQSVEVNDRRVLLPGRRSRINGDLKRR